MGKHRRCAYPRRGRDVDARMSGQSNWIAGAMVIGFIVYVTSRGSLPSYLSVLFGTATPASNASSASPAANALNTVNSAATSAGAAIGAATGLNNIAPAVSGFFGLQ